MTEKTGGELRTCHLESWRPMSTRDDRWAGMRGFGHLREGSEPLVHSQPVCVSWIAQIGDHPVSFLFFSCSRPLQWTSYNTGKSCTRTRHLTVQGWLKKNKQALNDGESLVYNSGEDRKVDCGCLWTCLVIVRSRRTLN